jgi:hypothetical protein
MAFSPYSAVVVNAGVITGLTAMYCVTDTSSAEAIAAVLSNLEVFTVDTRD